MAQHFLNKVINSSTVIGSLAIKAVVVMKYKVGNLRDELKNIEVGKRGTGDESSTEGDKAARETEEG